MSSLFKVGQVLKGQISQYIVTKEIQDTIWFARNTSSQQQVVIKSVQGHFRVKNERDCLRRFQSQTSCIRPIIDEIEEPAEPVTIVLKHLDDNLQRASDTKTLNPKELGYVSKRILEALCTVHADDFVHTDVKLDNVFVNYSHGDEALRFTDVELGDFGSVCHINDNFAKEAAPIGAPIWRSPEAMLQIPAGWNTATDIWSFGLCIIALAFGEGFHIFKPRKVPFGHEDYELNILMEQYKYFGPYPPKYEALLGGDKDLDKVIEFIFLKIPQSDMKPFALVTEREVSKRDKDFICKIMKMDPRDRPTAEELLQDPWFQDDVEG